MKLLCPCGYRFLFSFLFFLLLCFFVCFFCPFLQPVKAAAGGLLLRRCVCSYGSGADEGEEEMPVWCCCCVPLPFHQRINHGNINSPALNDPSAFGLHAQQAAFVCFKKGSNGDGRQEACLMVGRYWWAIPAGDNTTTASLEGHIFISIFFGRQ